MLEPSGLIGCWRPPNMYWTWVVHDFVVSWPTLSVAVALVVFGPTAVLSLGCGPERTGPRPAAMGAWTPAAFSRTAAGHPTERLGGSASTCVESEAEPDSLPTASLT